ncbi:sporulation protein [Nonomuraea sp. NPDC046802]|uniref:sporulation protein n=1 Tax=Nonomuraea sp. NPDC046802 TaxID=3154919 RepID=UPI0033DD9A82
MALKRLLTAAGAPALAVETTLTTPRIRPGGLLAGTVRLWDGRADADIEHLAVVLRSGEQLEPAPAELHRAQVRGPFTLRRGEEIKLGFQIPVPWETPISVMGGRRISGLALGARADITTATAADHGHTEFVAVEPLPSQLRVLQALMQLGCQLNAADLMKGRMEGAGQELPFHQEISFHPSVLHGGIAGQVRLSWAAGAQHLHLTFEAGHRSGRAVSGDAVARFHISHAEALHTDWPSEIDRWLTLLLTRGGRGRPDSHR